MGRVRGPASMTDHAVQQEEGWNGQRQHLLSQVLQCVSYERHGLLRHERGNLLQALYVPEHNPFNGAS